MPRKMTTCLTPGSIGVKANQAETIQYAHDYGFEAAQPFADELAGMSPLQMDEVNAKRKALRIEWGQSSLLVDFRKDVAQFRKDLLDLPKQAQALEKAGASRVGTWISPNHDSLPYLANLKQHSVRLREVARILSDHGQRLGLEYVGPKTLWTAKRYPFIHSMAEMKELLAEIAMPNTGFVLDSWHWYTANETVDDLRSLSNRDIICIDLNDAPAGIPLETQIDNKREIPLATGVIDLKGFLAALQKLGCDAPARCEPFNAALRAKPKEEILSTVAASMRRAFSLVEAAG